jgi:hypothetical protein
LNPEPCSLAAGHALNLSKPQRVLGAGHALTLPSTLTRLARELEMDVKESKEDIRYLMDRPTQWQVLDERLIDEKV